MVAGKDEREGAGGMDQLAEFMSNMHETLGSIP